MKSTFGNMSESSELTVGGKIIRALEIIRVQNSDVMQFCGINICQDTIFRLYTVYKKPDMRKIDNQTTEKSQVL